MERIARPLFALALALSLAACGSSGGGSEPTPPPSGPSGSLGVVTAEDATTAVAGLCEMRNEDAVDLAKANGVFYDRVHERLHTIAAAAEERDRIASATLLEAKEKVEEDLRSDDVPDSFVADLDALIAAARTALDVIGLSTPGCGG